MNSVELREHTNTLFWGILSVILVIGLCTSIIISRVHIVEKKVDQLLEQKK